MYWQPSPVSMPGFQLWRVKLQLFCTVDGIRDGTLLFYPLSMLAERLSGRLVRAPSVPEFKREPLDSSGGFRFWVSSLLPSGLPCLGSQGDAIFAV